MDSRVATSATGSVATASDNGVFTTPIVGRFGGEEFVVLQLSATREELALVAERPRVRVADLRVQIGHPGRSVDASGPDGVDRGAVHDDPTVDPRRVKFTQRPSFGTAKDRNPSSPPMMWPWLSARHVTRPRQGTAPTAPPARADNDPGL